MYIYMWEYRVRPGCTEVFLKHYSAAGSWVTLFQQAPGHVRTDLIQDREDPARFVTIDTWESFERHAEFRRAFAREFEELDRVCEELTVSEKLIGHFGIP